MVPDFSTKDYSPWRDMGWLLGLGLVVIGVGIGLRDPWPSDEPRYALIALQMVQGGEWLIPRRGIEFYADKPPIFFWCVAAFYRLTGSINVALLLPSLLAGLASLALVYDLARRLFDRRAGVLAAIGLLACMQFTLQARSGQIDMLLFALTTAALYGLMRHFFEARNWWLYYLAFVAMGLGIITKGVGFLPLLLLFPVIALRMARWPGLSRGSLGWPAWLGPLWMAAAAGLWMIPMWLATGAEPALLAYRQEILFEQTATRYTAAWHHQQPWWYLLAQAAVFWLPLTLALPWLVPGWWRQLRERDGRFVVLLSWIVLIVLFFSLSPGKRGVYIMPAAAALAVAAAPLWPHLSRQHGARWVATGFVLLCGLVALGASAWLGWFDPAKAQELMRGEDAPIGWFFAAVAGLAAASLLFIRQRKAVWRVPAFLFGLWIIYGLVGYPLLNNTRSSVDMMAQVSQTVGEAPLALVDWEEQILLEAPPQTVEFGFSRPFEAQMVDAIAWLAEHPDGWILTQRRAAVGRFNLVQAVDLGSEHGRQWVLVNRAAQF